MQKSTNTSNINWNSKEQTKHPKNTVFLDPGYRDTLIEPSVHLPQFRVRSGLGPIWALMGPYKPLWALMAPYGPIWAHMGPDGPIWVLLDRSGHDQIMTFGRIWYVSGPEMVF